MLDALAVGSHGCSYTAGRDGAAYAIQGEANDIVEVASALNLTASHDVFSNYALVDASKVAIDLVGYGLDHADCLGK